MKQIMILAITLLTTTVFGYVDQKLPDGKWAYYGQEFYATLESNRKFEKTFFAQIFNEPHQTTNGRPDVIGNNCHRSKCYHHSPVGYDAARKIMFGELDTLRDNKGTYVLDVYCGRKFYFQSLDEVSNMHTQVNIEHTWPQSKFSGRFPKDLQKSDMHHLYLTDSQANSIRGNNPFGYVGSDDDRTGGEGCRKSKMGLIDGNAVYTPPAPHRGNVARALFYFSIRYELPITKSEEDILRQWHKVDPIDADEIIRHEAIAKHQKTRNPFIDHPELSDKISDF